MSDNTKKPSLTETLAKVFKPQATPAQTVEKTSCCGGCTCGSNKEKKEDNQEPKP